MISICLSCDQTVGSPPVQLPHSPTTKFICLATDQSSRLPLLPASPHRALHRKSHPYSASLKPQASIPRSPLRRKSRASEPTFFRPSFLRPSCPVPVPVPIVRIVASSHRRITASSHRLQPTVTHARRGAPGRTKAEISCGLPHSSHALTPSLVTPFSPPRVLPLLPRRLPPLDASILRP